MNYIIQNGDNLYEIARKNDINVETIIKHNPYLNPYNLMVGSSIYLPVVRNKEDFQQIKDDMRGAWEQHVFWTRLLIVSIVEGLADEKETTTRLLRNADDLANIFRPYYGNEVAQKIAQLITEHLVIGAGLIHALKNKSDDANDLNLRWYKNADEIAGALNMVNNNYSKERVRNLFYKHLDLTKEEVACRINKLYKKEIEVFDAVEKEALMMADYFTEGIIKDITSHR